MGSLVLTGDTSGSVTVAVPAVAGTNTATLPAATGTVMVSGNQPTFSAYMSAGQALSASTNTKLSFNTESYDTNSNYDNVTNYRFTPTVAGYYQVNGGVQFGGTTDGYLIIYKNGAADKYGQLAALRAAYIATIAAQVYCNGSTDYIEMYALTSVAGTTASGSALTYFQACLIRNA
jgi:hypothetical protein